MASQTIPQLETGWRPETPTDDTVLRRGVLALAAAWEVTGLVGDGRIHRDDECQAVDQGRPTGLFNSATLLRPVSEPAFGRVVDRIERFYGTRGSGGVLLWSPWPTPDLTARSWHLQGHPPLLYRPAGLPDGLAVGHGAAGDLTISEATTPRDLAEWCEVAVDAFPLPEVEVARTLLDPALLTDRRVRFLVGRVSNEAVAVGCQVIVNRTNVLLLSSVRPEHRGRGSYAELVAKRLASTPDLPSVAIVSDASRPVLTGRFGFLPVTRFTLWERART